MAPHQPARPARQVVSAQGGAEHPERAHPTVRERGAQATTPRWRRISRHVPARQVVSAQGGAEHPERAHQTVR